MTLWADLQNITVVGLKVWENAQCCKIKLYFGGDFQNLRFHWHFITFDILWHLTFRDIWHFMTFDISWNMTFHDIWHLMRFDIWNFMTVDISWHLTFGEIWYFIFHDIWDGWMGWDGRLSPFSTRSKLTTFTFQQISK